MNWNMAAEWASRSPILCLNSPGGNFIEGLRIAEYFMTVGANNEVTTYVEDKAECYSACALIFLAGRLNDRGGETYPARFLNVGGQLGFHAPYINPSTLEDRSYSRTELAQIYKVAISSVTAAIQLFDERTLGGPKGNDDNRPWVSSSLFIEMLKKNPDELLNIDTVGKVGRWGIGLVGVRETNTLPNSALRQACDNTSAWQNDQEGSAEPIYEPLSPSDPDLRYFNRMQGTSVFRIKGMRHTYFCLIKPLFAHPDGTVKQGKLDGAMVKLLQSTLELRPGATIFDDGYEVPRWAAAFSPDTPLIALGQKLRTSPPPVSTPCPTGECSPTPFVPCGMGLCPK